LFKSDRVLIGGDDTLTGKDAVNKLVNIYANWIPKEKILITNVWSSELTKLASNAMLAQRISSINSLSAICEKTGADIEELSNAIGMDSRISPHFLKASVGFGGSCFQKDILNLVYLCRYYGLYEVAEYWHQVVKINDYQKNRFVKRIINALGGDVKDKKIAILGWSFKANTNDSRESPAIYVAAQLLELGSTIKIYDPMVDEDHIIKDLKQFWESRNIGSNQIASFISKTIVCKDLNDCINDLQAAAILTEWEEFKKIKIDKKLTKTLLFDGRNISKNADYSIGK